MNATLQELEEARDLQLGAGIDGAVSPHAAAAALAATEAKQLARAMEVPWAILFENECFVECLLRTCVQLPFVCFHHRAIFGMENVILAST